MRNRRMFVGAAVSMGALVLPGVARAGGGDDGQGSGPPTLSAPLATGLAGPLQMAIGRDETIYVAQDFAGVLTSIHDGNQTVLASNPGGEIAGVAVAGRKVLYTTTNGDPQTHSTTAAGLSSVRRGTSTIIADLLAYETTNNPDQGVVYGFESIAPDCAAQLPPQLGPPSYTGTVDSHPFAVAAGSEGTTYIADAAGNDILAVGRNGHVRTVAVLPRQPLVVTDSNAKATGLPACAVGLTYAFEPVPTDVEVGRDGQLYVTTLPGGPEGPSLGARGSVYRINPRTGTTTRLATGFAGAVNLAIGDHGTVYVSELFGNRISRIDHGVAVPVLDVNAPAALEVADGHLYVAYDSLPPDNGPPDGKIATIELGHDD